MTPALAAAGLRRRVSWRMDGWRRSAPLRTTAKPSHNWGQKGALLGKHEALLQRVAEIRRAGRVDPYAGAVGLVASQALERQQRMGDVVGPLVRHEIAE